MIDPAERIIDAQNYLDVAARARRERDQYAADCLLAAVRRLGAGFRRARKRILAIAGGTTAAARRGSALGLAAHKEAAR